VYEREGKGPWLDAREHAYPTQALYRVSLNTNGYVTLSHLQQSGPDYTSRPRRGVFTSNLYTCPRRRTLSVG
jgi:hypothetical protein